MATKKQEGYLELQMGCIMEIEMVKPLKLLQTEEQSMTHKTG